MLQRRRRHALWGVKHPVVPLFIPACTCKCFVHLLLWYEGSNYGVFEQHLLTQQTQAVQQILLLHLKLTVL